MEHETLGFDDLEVMLTGGIIGLSVIRSLKFISEYLYKIGGIQIWFAEIKGPRWSYIAGYQKKQPSEIDIYREILCENIGIICADWGGLSEGDQDKLIRFLKKTISRKIIWS